MSRVGVLGGTFDPVHIGHLRAAEVARDALELDSVLFVPAAHPPHKQDVAVTKTGDRVKMLDAALADEARFELSTIEIERDGPSYTIDTLDELSRLNPGADYSFITGSDAFVEIRTWNRWEALLQRYRFVVHERPGVELDRASAVVPLPLRERLLLLRRPMLDLSSTEIRRAVRDGESIRFLVPHAVADYIRRNRLYEQARM